MNGTAKYHPLQYVRSLVKWERLQTRRVNIGDLPLGAAFPVRVQSMTNTPTMDTRATVAQARALFESGCDYVRITARNLSEAKNLAEIKKQLHRDGFRNPLIADIHFNPEVALVAARMVEKVRINPGNYADNEKHKSGRFSDDEQAGRIAVEQIASRLKPLIDVCREYGTAVRVGVNHGSLSRRILARYGNTAEGMVESAMEFIHVISSLDFHKLVLSMKSSDLHVMIHAYRLLVQRMGEQGFNYPLHLGVTEAGGGEDGLIKSASGIGALLADGIGDTLRVSLTGDPLYEVPAAKRLAVMFGPDAKAEHLSDIRTWYDPISYRRRNTHPAGIIGGANPVSVIVNGFMAKAVTEFCFAEKPPDENQNSPDMQNLLPFESWHEYNNVFPVFPSPAAYEGHQAVSSVMNLILVRDAEQAAKIAKLHSKDKSLVAILECNSGQRAGISRLLFSCLNEAGCDIPVVLKTAFIPGVAQAEAAAYLSALLADGFGDAVWIDNALPDDAEKAGHFAFSLLQSHGLRRTRAEFVSCPTCGRTTYDVEAVLAEIRRLCGHLKHLKIGVMGCIVNGPGEMAGADYGCVGSAPGKVNIYKGENVIFRNIPERDAAGRLWELITRSENLL